MTTTDSSYLYTAIADYSSYTTDASTAITDTATDIGADFDTFLQMLTTQMTNQDPLDPDDPSDFATQLAQFSAVEQSVLTNDLLADVISALTVTDDPTSLMGQWIGKDALVQSDVYYEGEPIAAKALINGSATSAQFVVTNANGEEILRTPIDTTQTEVYWGGADDTGTEVEDGYYTITVESYLDGTLLASEQALAFVPVSEVSVVEDQLLLTFDDGSQMLASEAYGMREST